MVSFADPVLQPDPHYKGSLGSQRRLFFPPTINPPTPHKPPTNPPPTPHQPPTNPPPEPPGMTAEDSDGPGSKDALVGYQIRLEKKARHLPRPVRHAWGMWFAVWLGILCGLSWLTALWHLFGLILGFEIAKSNMAISFVVLS